MISITTLNPPYSFRGMVGTFCFVLIVLFFAGAPSNAQNYGTFYNFFEKEAGQSGGYKYEKNPTDDKRFHRVHSFSIVPGCHVSPDKNGYSDCHYNSVRSELAEDVWEKKSFGLGQPAEAWYGWNVYVPESFPRASQQPGGKYTIGQWHNGQCPHLGIVNSGETEKVYIQFLKQADQNYACRNVRKLEVADFGKMRGKWTRFEVFVKWSTGADGELQVFVNGENVQSFNGATLVKGLEHRNYFNFGVYLCCTRNINAIKPATLLYANVSRASSRRKLK